MFRKPVSLHKGKILSGLAVALVLIGIVSVFVICRGSGGQDLELSRMLAYLPPLPEPSSPDENGLIVSFSNPAELKQEYGYPEDLLLKKTPVSMIDGLLTAVGPAGICASMDVYFETLDTQMDIGYDVMAVERCIEGGGVTVLEGDFDPKQVAASLESLGYDADQYEGVTTYHFNGVNYKGKVGRELAEKAGHVAALRKAVVLAATAERLQAALDVWKKRADNLSGTPGYIDLAEALGPSVSAGFFPRGDQLAGIGYQDYTITEDEAILRQRSQPSCTSPGGQERFGGQWLGSRSEVKIRRILLASTYATAEEATAEEERLAKSLEAHAYADYWLWTGEPVITESEEGTILMVALELTADAPGDIFEEMISAWSQILGADQADG
jgi:hypothetical protein